MFDGLLKTVRGWFSEPEPADDWLYVSPSPYRTAEALVDQEDRTAYFYLVTLKAPDQRWRQCWVRNLDRAPLDYEAEGTETPLMPFEHCRHPNGAEPLSADRLSALWLPAGDGVALFEDDELIAFIPPWSGEDDFWGYARDCKGQSALAWDLAPARGEIDQRLAEARAFWNAWSSRPIWQQSQPQFIDSAESVLGPHSRYFAIDGGEWPPKALLVFEELDDWKILVTIGVSLCPQPRVAADSVDPSIPRRIELALAVPAHLAEDLLDQCIRGISGLAELPWAYGSFLGHLHTVPMSCFPAAKDGSALPAAILTNRHEMLPMIEFPEIFGEPVQLLWVIPITAAERQLAIQSGSEELLSFLDHAPPVRFSASSPRSLVRNENEL